MQKVLYTMQWDTVYTHYFLTHYKHTNMPTINWVMVKRKVLFAFIFIYFLVVQEQVKTWGDLISGRLFFLRLSPQSRLYSPKQNGKLPRGPSPLQGPKSIRFTVWQIVFGHLMNDIFVREVQYQLRQVLHDFLILWPCRGVLCQNVKIKLCLIKFSQSNWDRQPWAQAAAFQYRSTVLNGNLGQQGIYYIMHNWGGLEGADFCP